jgi:small-conductance mechanosensitive channel
MNMAYWGKIYFGNTLETWIIALGVMLVTFAILKIIQRLVISHLSRLTKRIKTQIDDLFVTVLSRTNNLFLFILSVYISSNLLVWQPAMLKVWNKIALITVIVQIAFWVSGGMSFFISLTVKKRMADDAASATTISILGFVGKLVLWSIALLLLLDNLGVNITSLVAGLGIGGIAVALATQNILGDLFASLSIVIDKPFAIGDFIAVDQLTGTVEHIGLKTTRVRSLIGEQLIFSNTDLLKSRIRNYRRMQERRIVFTFGVIYRTPLIKLTLINNIIREIIEKREGVRFERVHFKEYGESALNFEVVYFVLSQDYNLYMDIQQDINLEMLQRFQEEGIEFAYPTRTVLVSCERHSNAVN